MALPLSANNLPTEHFRLNEPTHEISRETPEPFVLSCVTDGYLHMEKKYFFISHIILRSLLIAET